MKYTKEERLAIGKRIYDGEINRSMAAVEYDIDIYTARDYLRLYKASLALTEKMAGEEKPQVTEEELRLKYVNKTKKELINELIKLQLT